ncbi:MAG TPA: thioesterase family protein [Thermoanaerobaculia bacterium]|nr:thioesterase family protein [Thermoanaerobaculia bacterium]
MSDPVRCTIDVEVRYVETDQMGVVHHSNYLAWFELARTALCRQGGRGYHQIEQDGHWLMVTGAQLRYRGGARYGDVVQVECWIDDLKSRTLTFAYRVRRGEELLVSGATDHVWVEAGTKRLCRIPEALRPHFERMAGRPAEPVAQKQA